MIAGIIGVLFCFWLATFIVFYLHEVGHFGDSIRITKVLPYPKMYSFQSRTRYGGLIVNAIIFYAVFVYQPENVFLQTVGLVSWAHFVIYTILGSFNQEIKVPKMLWDVWVFDDVPNELWWIFVPLGVGALVYFKDFYIPIVINLLQLV